MKKILHKLQTILLILTLLFIQISPVYVMAADISPEPTQVQEAPVQEPTPAPTSIENYSPSPTESIPSPTPTMTPDQIREAERKTAEEAFIADYLAKHPELTNQQNTSLEAQRKAAEEAYLANINPPAPTATPSPANSITQNSNAGPSSVLNGQTGDTVLSTGNAYNNGSSTIIGNQNLTASGPVIVDDKANGNSIIDQPEGSAVINNGNGTGSSNNGISNSVSNNTTTQDNSAVVTNNSNQSSSSGNNQSSYNNGNTTINTGDSNTSGTAITAVNTNVDAVSISEFNVVDDQTGDIILTPEAFTANCISGCQAQGTAVNSNNGANSQNNTNIDSVASDNTFQNNDAVVGNNMTLSANSGANDSSYNTGGDTIINTGDANVSANSLTFVNNNISGNVQFGIVNIYGTLDGNIILPDYTVYNPDPQAVQSAVNSDNGSSSSNNSQIASETNNSTFQNNDAAITNNLVIDAQTGNNSSDTNTNGDTTIKTGDTKVDANIVNVANTNISSGQDMWLVFVFNAGKWVGQLLGAPAGSAYAGSDGTQFVVDPQTGQITASNNGNGSGSDNNAGINNNTNNTTIQTNTANINNTLNLSANTGGNSTNYNTGGNNIINTGDANIIANLMNFANNNIVGTGTLRILFVNIFGKLNGDVVTPDYKPAENTTPTPSPANQQSSLTASNNSSTPTPTPDASAGTWVEKNTGLIAGAVAAIGKTAASVIVPDNSNKALNYSLKKGSTAKVAGISDSKTGNLLADASYSLSPINGGIKNKTININIAWLLLLIPLIGIFYTGKFLLKKRLFIKVK